MGSIQDNELGKKGERLAQNYLVNLGYVVVAQNLRSPYGEIDLVVQKEKHLFFVEIKTRSSQTYGLAIDAITPQKQKKVRKNAEYWLLQKKEWQDYIPFLSVVALDETQTGEFDIEFLPDAF